MKVLIQRLMEHAALGRKLGKQGHRGVKLQVVGMTENLGDRAIFNVQDQLSTGTQARSQLWVFKVGKRLFAGADREMPRHFAATEAGELREDKPHPVTTFLTVAQFLLDPFKHGVLSLDEPWQIKSIELIGASHAEVL